jgi:hypothetical protein
LPTEERKVAVIKQSIDRCYRIWGTWGHPFLWMGFVNYETVPVAKYLQLIWSPPHYCGCASCWAGLTTASLSWAASKQQYSLSLYWYLIPSFRWVLTKVHTMLFFLQHLPFFINKATGDGFHLLWLSHSHHNQKKPPLKSIGKSSCANFQRCFRVWFGSYSNSGCTITILKAAAGETNYCTTQQGTLRWALLWMCAPCLLLPCSINPKS